MNFFALKSKIYSLVIAVKQIKKAKGANENVVKNMRHKKDVDILFNKNLFTLKMKRIQN